MPVKKLRGVGIDLVSLPRARRFVKDHGARAARLAGKKSPTLSAVEFARIFAAKEAYFKALGLSWMGLEGFESIKVKSSPRDHFQVQSTLFKGPEASGTFFSGREWAGAQVIIWGKNELEAGIKKQEKDKV